MLIQVHRGNIADAEKYPYGVPANHGDPPKHRQRQYIPARRRQDQGPPEAPPEKVPCEAPAEHANPRNPRKGMI